MKTIYSIVLILMSFLVVGCSSNGTTVDPMVERIAKSWNVSVVREGNSVVFEIGGSNNTRPGYVNFTVNLSGGGTVSYTDFNST